MAAAESCEKRAGSAQQRLIQRNIKDALQNIYEEKEYTIYKRLEKEEDESRRRELFVKLMKEYLLDIRVDGAGDILNRDVTDVVFSAVPIVTVETVQAQRAVEEYRKEDYKGGRRWPGYPVSARTIADMCSFIQNEDVFLPSLYAPRKFWYLQNIHSKPSELSNREYVVMEPSATWEGIPIILLGTFNDIKDLYQKNTEVFQKFFANVFTKKFEVKKGSGSWDMTYNHIKDAKSVIGNAQSEILSVYNELGELRKNKNGNDYVYYEYEDVSELKVLRRSEFDGTEQLQPIDLTVPISTIQEAFDRFANGRLQKECTEVELTGLVHIKHAKITIPTKSETAEKPTDITMQVMVLRETAKNNYKLGTMYFRIVGGSVRTYYRNDFFTKDDNKNRYANRVRRGIPADFNNMTDVRMVEKQTNYALNKGGNVSKVYRAGVFKKIHGEQKYESVQNEFVTSFPDLKEVKYEMFILQYLSSDDNAELVFKPVPWYVVDKDRYLKRLLKKSDNETLWATGNDDLYKNTGTPTPQPSQSEPDRTNYVIIPELSDSTVKCIYFKTDFFSSQEAENPDNLSKMQKNIWKRIEQGIQEELLDELFRYEHKQRVGIQHVLQRKHLIVKFKGEESKPWPDADKAALFFQGKLYVRNDVNENNIDRIYKRTSKRTNKDADSNRVYTNIYFRFSSSLTYPDKSQQIEKILKEFKVKKPLNYKNIVNKLFAQV